MCLVFLCITKLLFSRFLHLNGIFVYGQNGVTEVLEFWFSLQIHLSLSQLGGGAGGDKSQTHIGGSFLSLLSQSVGVAVTEVQDVEFKWVTGHVSTFAMLSENFLCLV